MDENARLQAEVTRLKKVSLSTSNAADNNRKEKEPNQKTKISILSIMCDRVTHYRELQNDSIMIHRDGSKFIKQIGIPCNLLPAFEWARRW